MSLLDSLDMDHLIATARQAGDAILEVYKSDFKVARKADKSPLTEADLLAHQIITSRLAERYPGTSILSEENAHEVTYAVRRGWKEFWLVDPLDGTKEFIKRNGQFTVNVALIKDSRPAAGVVYAPALDLLYYVNARREAFKVEANGHPIRLAAANPPKRDRLVIAGSLSHRGPEMDAFVSEQSHRYKTIEFIAMGSSIKICMVADGRADIYPRLGPTMEWDTAAGHAIANGAGRKVLRYATDRELRYNKRNLRNDWFVVR